MWTLITAPETRIFGVALALMLMLGILELLSMMAGGLNEWVDGLLPDSLTDPAHPELGVEAAEGALIRFLSWLYVGRVPLLMLMVVFLAVYGLLGYALQSGFQAALGAYLNGVLAAILAWFLSLPVVRVLAAGLYKIMPKDETTAIAENDLIGRVGVVVLGTAEHDKAAQVRVKDGFGQQHYVMVYADGTDALPEGSVVLLVARQGSYFTAIVNPNADLVD